MIGRALLALSSISSISWGCGSGATPAPQSPPERAPRSAYDELEARLPPVLDAMNRLAASIQATAGECPQIAAAIRGFGARHAADMSELWALRAKLTPEESDRWEHAHDEDADRLDAVFRASMASCRGDAEVEAALQTSGFRER